MKKMYRIPLDYTLNSTSKNKQKIKFKNKVIREFLDEFDITNVKTITFNEDEETNLIEQTIFYYIEIETMPEDK